MRVRMSAGLIGLMLLGACAQPRVPACGAGEQAAVIDTLYFGTARPGGVVTAEDWDAFLGRAVTPRFPDGLTFWSASGQWRGSNGAISHEATRVLQIVHPDSVADDAVLRTIMRDYAAQFQQEAVLRVRAPGCMSLQGG